MLSYVLQWTFSVAKGASCLLIFVAACLRSYIFKDLRIVTLQSSMPSNRRWICAPESPSSTAQDTWAHTICHVLIPSTCIHAFSNDSQTSRPLFPSSHSLSHLSISTITRRIACTSMPVHIWKMRGTFMAKRLSMYGQS